MLSYIRKLFYTYCSLKLWTESCSYINTEIFAVKFKVYTWRKKGKTTTHTKCVSKSKIWRIKRYKNYYTQGLLTLCSHTNPTQKYMTNFWVSVENTCHILIIQTIVYSPHTICPKKSILVYTFHWWPKSWIVFLQWT